MNVMKMFDLSGRVAVITGAGNGLGFEFAEAMAEAGADVVCADIDTQNNERTAARVTELGRKALAVRCDVTNQTDVAALFAQADKEFGRVDIAFANAGIADPAPQPLHDYPTANWNQVLARFDPQDQRAQDLHALIERYLHRNNTKHLSRAMRAS